MSINSFPSGTVDRSIGLAGTRATHGISLARFRQRERDGKERQSQLRSRDLRDTESIFGVARDHRGAVHRCRVEERCSSLGELLTIDRFPRDSVALIDTFLRESPIYAFDCASSLRTLSTF